MWLMMTSGDEIVGKQDHNADTDSSDLAYFEKAMGMFGI